MLHNKIIITKQVKNILDKLEQNGYEAYIVGGCVRDQLLGKEVSDFDITTNAKPDEIKKIFKRTVDTGIKHGTVVVVLYDKDKKSFLNYEITTFRTDGEYKDFRHPREVFFVDDLYEDLSRRDFTINALAYNEKKGLVDKFNGLSDLQHKLIKAVLNPVDRYNEDALRMLRCIRFAAKLGFSIEKETFNAICKCKDNIKNVSKERIQAELNKVLISDNPEFLKMIFDIGMADYIAKDFNKISIEKFIKTDDMILAYASLFYNNVDIAFNVLKELKFDNETIKNVLKILNNKNDFLNIISNYVDYKEFILKNIICNIGFINTYRLIKLVCIKENIDLSYIKEKVRHIESNNEPIFLTDLSINGNDLLLFGFKGKKVGEILNYLLDLVHKDKSINEKNKLVDIIKDKML